MQIKSVFKNGEKIPVKYTADGTNINPPLEIFDIPKETIVKDKKSFPNKSTTN